MEGSSRMSVREKSFKDRGVVVRDQIIQERGWQTFSLKDQTINTLGFGAKRSLLFNCHCSAKIAIDYI